MFPQSLGVSAVLVTAALLFATALASASGSAPRASLLDPVPHHRDRKKKWEPVFEWTNVTYDFQGSPWGDSAADAQAAGAYTIENNVITGVNYHRLDNGTELFFVCVPRWRSGVPSTLNVVDHDSSNSTTNASRLKPWPSWEFNTETVRYVQSVWVEQSTGLIYIIDAGRENFLGDNSSNIINGSASLHVLNISTKERVYHHVFSDDIFFPNSSFLNDIVLDAQRNVAYMSDTNTLGFGGIVSHDLNTGFSRRFHGPSTLAQPWYHVEMLGKRYPLIDSPSDGITLSSDGGTLFYSVIEGASLFALDAFTLSDPNATIAEVQKSVQNITQKGSFSDGLRTLPHGNLDIVLYGANGNCSLNIAIMKTQQQREGVPEKIGSQGGDRNVTVLAQEVLYADDEQLQWMDTFAFIPKEGKEGGLVLFTTNRLQRWLSRTMDFTGGEGANMRMFGFKWGSDHGHRHH